MNNLELLNELNNFSKSTYNVILIDGPWGSGKTYLINNYIKANQDKLKIFYVSMLGKKNVDDINTSLYGEIHHDASLISIVPSAINPLQGVSDDKSLDFILKLKNDNGDVIVILDDLERYASSDYDEFLSYITNLVLNGAKVICVSNLGELGTGELYNFNLYKEKIFDRVYKAELFNADILNQKFGRFAQYLDENIINLYNKNFRVVDKCSNFLEEVTTKLENNSVFLSDFDYKALVYYVSLIINVYFNNKKKRLEDFKIRPSREVINYNKNMFLDEEDAYEATYIYEYSLNTLYMYKYEEEFRYITKLLYAYLFDRFDYLIDFYNEDFKCDHVENFDDLLNLRAAINMNSDKNLKVLYDIVKSNLTNIQLVYDYLNNYQDNLSDKEIKFYKELVNDIKDQQTNGFIAEACLAFDNKDYKKLFNLINLNINFFTKEVSKENLEVLRNYKYFLNFDDEQYLIRNKIYLLNYADILKASSFMVDVLDYLNSKKYSSEIYQNILDKFNYIREEISD